MDYECRQGHVHVPTGAERLRFGSMDSNGLENSLRTSHLRLPILDGTVLSRRRKHSLAKVGDMI